jgi:ABC-type multidrug transport system fused ATPase/permease subunit
LKRSLIIFLSPIEKKPASTWPSEGAIQFEHLYMKYAENQPPVLKDLNFKIEPTHKVCATH